MLKAKLHRVTVTDANLQYEGSCGIDGALMDAAGILQYEQVAIYNLANGERLTTYAIREPRGSGRIVMNGAAAHKARVGDQIIICTYAQMSPDEAAHHWPTIIHVDEANVICRK